MVPGMWLSEAGQSAAGALVSSITTVGFFLHWIFFFIKQADTELVLICPEPVLNNQHGQYSLML